MVCRCTIRRGRLRKRIQSDDESRPSSPSASQQPLDSAVRTPERQQLPPQGSPRARLHSSNERSQLPEQSSEDDEDKQQQQQQQQQQQEPRTPSPLLHRLKLKAQREKYEAASPRRPSPLQINKKVKEENSRKRKSKWSSSSASSSEEVRGEY